MTRYSAEQGLEIAMLLGAMRGIELDDEALLQRYRLDIGTWALSIRRRYRVGETVTVDEARHVLETRAAPAETIEVTSKYFCELDLWLALIDPDSAVLQRAAELTGVDASELAHRFATELDVDLERCTLGATPWFSLQIRNSWIVRTIVEQAHKNTELRLADAQRFVPNAKRELGDTIKLPSPIRAKPLVWEPESLRRD
jgi:hypothetical protein